MKNRNFIFLVIFLGLLLSKIGFSQCDYIPIPANPQNQVICQNNEIPSLTVDEPAVGFRINWYDEMTDGTILSEGFNFYISNETTPGVYTYYAETEEIATTCKSDRIPVSLTINANPQITIIPDSYFCCSGGEISFEFSSTSNLVYYNWFFDGAALNTSSVANPQNILYPVSGTYDVNLVAEDDNTCQGTNTIQVFVSETFAGINSLNGPICYNSPAFNLSAQIPGGVWQGTGITDSINGTFDPSVAGIGMQLVFYQITNGSECSILNDFVFTVYDANVSPVITDVSHLYADDEPVTLHANIQGGTWSGTGITDASAGIFDPSVAGIGLHTITYYVEFGDCSGTAQTVINVTGVNVFGYLYNDTNANCIFDEGEAVPDRLIYANPGSFYAYTDENGYYKFFLDEGTYTIHAVPLQFYNISCPESGFQNITIENIEDTLQNINIGLYPTYFCPFLNTSVALAGIRPCFNSNIVVQYSNTGTLTAENAYIDVQLSSVMTYVSSTLPYSSVSGNVYRFELNNIDPFESGDFVITVYVDCNLGLIGQTSCVTATIFPNTPCGTDFGDWDHSDIAVTGDCVENLNACFTITNNAGLGVGDMENAQDYRIFANDTLVFTGTFQLSGGASTEICWATNGSAIRLEADQHPEHPDSDYSVHTIEACRDNNGTSYGYITTNTYDDEGHFIDTYCREITSSYDPNAKEVYPSGITENNYIGDDITLTYQINFQNTGTDTAFTVVIVDTVSNLHNMMTFERGVSSHPCELEIYDPGILVWTFNNILLPDSTTNEVESHGFVTYTIKPIEMDQADYGTQIFNNAAIFFDYNPPVITNTTRLTYWKLPILLNGIKPDFSKPCHKHVLSKSL